MDKTIEYYNRQSAQFTQDTVNVEFTDIQDGFLKYLKEGSLILDFGCGSGRDSRYFLQKGYLVEASDGSEAMVETASRNTGLPVRHMLFQELDENEKYDGIFACASILHVPYNELTDVMNRIWRALKNNGIAYVSFKYGDFEGYRNGRYFTDMNEERFSTLLETVRPFEILEQRITGDARPGRADEKWMNVILRKK